MRSAIIFILLFLQTSGFYAQIHLNILPKRPYESLIFKELKPIWYETLYDPAFIGGDTCNGYNLFKRMHDILEFFDDVYVNEILSQKWRFSRQRNLVGKKKCHVT
jgi:hypothetical protein